MSPISPRAASIILVLLLAHTSVFADATLCDTSEEVVFSCPTGNGKIASVCARANGKGGGVISYRFGTPQINDLTLIADTSDVAPAIEYDDQLWARAYDYSVSFKRRNYLYVVQQRWDGCPWSPDTESCSDDSFFAGVVVYKSGKKIAVRTCGVRHSLDADILNKYNVPRSNGRE